MRRLSAIVSLVIWFAPGAARADEDELDMGRIVAEEPRPYRLVHEFRAGAGVLPIDAFSTALALGASYTLHLNDVWAWTAIDLRYALQIDTGVEEMLASRWSIAPAFDGAALQYLLGTQLVATPLYGKLVLFGEELVHVDGHFSAGIGAVRYSDGFRAALDAGPGVRFFLSPAISVSADVRAHLIADAPGGASFLLGFHVSIASTFGSTRVTERAGDVPVKKTADGMKTLDELYPSEEEP